MTTIVGFLFSRISVYVIYYSQYYIDSNPSFRLVEFQEESFRASF